MKRNFIILITCILTIFSILLSAQDRDKRNLLMDVY